MGPLDGVGVLDLTRVVAGPLSTRVLADQGAEVMAKFGLGPDEMCERFPALVYCSITGFGQDGPWADRRAYAPMGHLESGLLAHAEVDIDRK